MKEIALRNRIIRNIKALMDAAGDGQHDLARRCRMRQSTIRNMLSGKHGIGTERADMIAKAYGLQAWHLMILDLPPTLSDAGAMADLLEKFMQASPEGRELIRRVAEREAQYAVKEDPTGTED